MKSLSPLLLPLLLLAACATLKAPFAEKSPLVLPQGAADGRELSLARVQSELATLHADPNLNGRAPDALKEAETAVADAAQNQHDNATAAQRLYVADRKLARARALAEADWYRAQTETLSPPQDQVR